jgi:hypothetical protein
METKGGGDPSLIPKLNGRILTIKDYTTIFGMDKNEQQQITTQLRDAYDGKAAKPYGNGMFRKFKSTFGIIAGVTPAIEKHMEGSTALGERFIRVRIPIPSNDDEHAMQRKAMDNNAHEETMRKDLSELAVRAMSYDYMKDGLAVLPEEIKDLIIYGAQWSAKMRGTIERNTIGQVTHKANREIATRLTKVLAKLITALALFRGRKEVNMDDWNTVKHVMYSTIPEMRTDILKYMYMNGKEKYWEPHQVSHATGVTKSTTEREMENLVMLEMLSRNPVKFPVSFRISEQSLKLLEQIGVFKKKENVSDGKPKSKPKSTRK